MSAHHIIRQQFLDVEVHGTESDGLALQRSLSGLFQRELLPAIERALERCAPPEGHLVVERLEIDVGSVTMERLEHDLAESVARSVEKSLREQIPRDDGSPQGVSGNVRHKTTQQTLDEALLYFLQTGRLPWSFRPPQGSTLEQAIVNAWREAVQSGATPPVTSHAIFRALASATLASATARNRLVRQFTPLFLEDLFSRLSPAGKPALDGVLHVLRSSAVPMEVQKRFEQHLWEAAFAQLARGKIASSAELAGEAWRALPDAANQAALANLLGRHWPGVTRGSPAAVKTPKDRPGAPPAPTYGPAHLENAEGEDGEGIFVENAGLVLLHPFLPQFFQALGVAKGDTLVQPERALCLLHYLATGQTVAPEYELTLPKVLCNIPLETPVESDMHLTNQETDEAAVLLGAVIRHWEALRNTSPDGLRGTFLLRPGKVSLREDGDWLLQVESQTYDILLDQLPWGIGMIKLPWMERMLWVEWR